MGYTTEMKVTDFLLYDRSRAKTYHTIDYGDGDRALEIKPLTGGPSEQWSLGDFLFAITAEPGTVVHWAEAKERAESLHKSLAEGNISMVIGGIAKSVMDLLEELAPMGGDMDALRSQVEARLEELVESMALVKLQRGASVAYANPEQLGIFATIGMDLPF